MENDPKHDSLVNRNISTKSTTENSGGNYFAHRQVSRQLADLLTENKINKIMETQAENAHDIELFFLRFGFSCKTRQDQDQKLLRDINIGGFLKNHLCKSSWSTVTAQCRDAVTVNQGQIEECTCHKIWNVYFQPLRFSHPMNADTGLKTFAAAQRYFKTSSKKSVCWTDFKKDGIFSTVGGL